MTAWFPDDILENNSNLLLPKPKEDGHMGIGLTISEYSAKSTVGNLELSNNKEQLLKL